MYMNAYIISKAGTIEEVEEILKPYSKSITNAERVVNNYPSKIVWYELNGTVDYYMYYDERSRHDTIIKLLGKGYSYETPETLEYKYGIIVDVPQFGEHHQVYSIYDEYKVCELDEKCTEIKLKLKNCTYSYKAKIKDIYYKHNMKDSNYANMLKAEHTNSVLYKIPFEEYCGMYENNYPIAVIGDKSILESDYYLDEANKRTQEENYNDFIKLMDSLDPELYVTVVSLKI